MTIRLYDLLDSPFCLKARICLALKGVPYERVPLSIDRRGELRRFNALAKVPVLVTPSGVVADSSAIARHLDEQYPRRPLVPKDTSARAYAHVLEDWADESLSFLVGAFKWLDPANRARAYARSAELVPAWAPRALVLWLVRRRVAARYAASGYRERDLPLLERRMAENLAALADLLGENPFLLGRFVTIADIAVFAQLRWMAEYAQRHLFDAVPAVQTWMEQLDGVEEIQQAFRGEPPGAEPIEGDVEVAAG